MGETGLPMSRTKPRLSLSGAVNLSVHYHTWLFHMGSGDWRWVLMISQPRVRRLSHLHSPAQFKFKSEALVQKLVF